MPIDLGGVGGTTVTFGDVPRDVCIRTPTWVGVTSLRITHSSPVISQIGLAAAAEKFWNSKVRVSKSGSQSKESDHNAVAGMQRLERD